MSCKILPFPLHWTKILTFDKTLGRAVHRRAALRARREREEVRAAAIAEQWNCQRFVKGRGRSVSSGDLFKEFRIYKQGRPPSTNL